MSVSPVQAGALHQSGSCSCPPLRPPHAPTPLPGAPRSLPACSALGETLLPNTILGLIYAGAGPVIPVTAVHLDALCNRIKESSTVG